MLWDFLTPMQNWLTLPDWSWQLQQFSPSSEATKCEKPGNCFPLKCVFDNSHMRCSRYGEKFSLHRWISEQGLLPPSHPHRQVLAQVLALPKERKTKLLFILCWSALDPVSCLSHHPRLRAILSIEKNHLKKISSLMVVLTWHIVLHLAAGRKSSECRGKEGVSSSTICFSHFRWLYHVLEITTWNVGTSGNTRTVFKWIYCSFWNRTILLAVCQPAKISPPLSQGFWLHRTSADSAEVFEKILFSCFKQRRLSPEAEALLELTPGVDWDPDSIQFGRNFSNVSSVLAACQRGKSIKMSGQFYAHSVMEGFL